MEDQTKKNIKKVVIWFIIFIIGIYWGNFTSNNSIINKTNPFSYFLGQKSFDIGIYHGFEMSNQTITLTLDINNDGDKDIKDLRIKYSGCGVSGETKLKKPKLRREDPPENFAINLNPAFDKECSEKNPKTEVQVYEDSIKQCYLLIPNSFKEFCNYCNLSFYIYDGEKYIGTQEISYSDIQFKHKENMKEFIEFILGKYPLTLTWTEGYNSTCLIVKNNNLLKNLNKKESIYLTFFNFEESCEKFPDSVFCINFE